ncbi:condensation domain-containing protein, partial [uncultured Chitinophaga sp.]|uniref:condensation domain-containing protein n=1 Tax=uncultured Chitinophaga sp. TaxID=339340 RepID=UPI0026150E44
MITELYSRLKELKVAIQVVGDRLDLQAPKGVLDHELLNEIKYHKEDLIALISSYKQRKQAHYAVPKAASQDSYVLSPSQRRLWILSQLATGNTAYNMPGACTLEGKLDITALTFAFRSMIERHEILRTVFRQSEQGEPRQIILPAESAAAAFQVTCEDLRQVSEQQNRLQKLVQQDMQHAFDLSTGSLLHTALYQIQDDRWVLTYVMHHICSDGWSMGIFIRELLQLYNAYIHGEQVPLQPLPIQYKDYAAWQQQQLSGESLQLHRSYWLKQFEGNVPVLELPLDNNRPPVKSFRGYSVSRWIDNHTIQQLKACCHQQDATLFMGLLATVTILLQRYTGQHDIVTGTVIAGRQHADLEDQIGCYLNTLALRLKPEQERSFNELLQQARQVTLGAYEHQVYPFDQLVEELQLQHDINRNPVFDVSIVLQNADADHSQQLQKLEELKISPYAEQRHTTSKFDLSFEFTEVAGGLQANFVYNTDIYTEQTISRMADHLQRLMEALIVQPLTPLKQLNYLSEEEQHQ